MDNNCNCFEIIWVPLTAIASWALVIVTWYMIRKQVKLGKDDLKVRLQVDFDDKFEGHNMTIERKRLAEQLLANATHDDIKEPIINFFESLGLLLRKNYLDSEMIWSSFAFYIIRWWAACKDYIIEERKRQNNDDTIFSEFEFLVDEMYKVEMKKRALSRIKLEPSRDEIIQFLNEEKEL